MISNTTKIALVIIAIVIISVGPIYFLLFGPAAADQPYIGTCTVTSVAYSVGWNAATTITCKDGTIYVFYGPISGLTLNHTYRFYGYDNTHFQRYEEVG